MYNEIHPYKENKHGKGTFNMTLIEKAIRFASEAHEGQTDKAGLPLILHPLHVMSLMKSEKARVTAVLHDVLEDTVKTEDDLNAEGFPGDIVEAVKTLTRQKDEDYFDYIRRIQGNELAVEVKLGDLTLNMDIGRLPYVDCDAIRRAEKYKKARFLLALGERRRRIERETAELTPEMDFEYAREALLCLRLGLMRLPSSSKTGINQPVGPNS